MRFAILGATGLSVDGRPVPLGGLKQRALLAFLLLHPNEVRVMHQMKLRSF